MNNAELENKKDMLQGLKNAELKKCSHCMTSKQTRVSFKNHPPLRKSELLELVHSDVCGPLKVKNLLVYALKIKDKVLEKFKQFQTLVERQSDKNVKYIHSNNGDEYCGPLDGIRHEKTLPKTPQSNDLVERMNKTLIKRVRYMLSETLYTTVHVINLNSINALNTEVPDKICFGKDVKCDCESSVGEYGYKLYDPIKNVRSRYVQFMEYQTIEDINKVKKTTHDKNNSLSKIDPV
ncbi:hypothetical protein CR513_14491, partial [Mucuna pruriens]